MYKNYEAWLEFKVIPGLLESLRTSLWELLKSELTYLLTYLLTHLARFQSIMYKNEAWLEFKVIPGLLGKPTH